MKISWIKNHPALQQLLSNHRGTLRVLGADEQREGDFLSTVDAKDRRLSAFRGVTAFFNSPFEVKSPDQFRGANTREYESEVEFHGSRQEAQNDFEQSARINPEDEALLAQNEKLRKLFEEDGELREAFIEGNQFKAEEKLGEVAKSELEWTPELTTEYLQAHPDEALAIAANLGDIQEYLDDPEKARALTDVHYERYRSDIIEKLADKAVDKIEGTEVLDKDFFIEHPKAALYLLANPEERKSLINDDNFEREFIRHIESYEALVDPVSEAQELAGSNPTLNDAFWSDNEDLSLMLVAEIASGMGNSLQETAHNYSSVAYQSTTSAEFLRQNQADHAEEALGESDVIKRDFLVKHYQFSRFISENPDFARKLVEDSNTSGLLDSGSDEIDKLVRTYASGLPLRNNRSWQWWA